jgi:4-hydroxy 2-oxovalerate aldolase
MGTDVPEFCKSNTYELEAIRFTDRYTDSCTAVALQVALNFDKSKVVSVGYDGYTGGILSEKEMTLTNENKSLFHSYYRFKGERLISLTPTIYKELNITSIYQYLS